MAKTRQEESSGTAIKEEIRTKEPSLFRVLLLNDHYTTMEFVVLVLETIFKKNDEEAQAIMLLVHKNGSGVAGTYTKEIAETKAALVHHLAKQNGFPLKCVIEPT